MIKRLAIYMAIASLIFMAVGCGGGSSDSAPAGSTITINPEEVTFTDGLTTRSVSSQFFTITVTDENGIPYDEVEINISFILAAPYLFPSDNSIIVQLYDGNTPVDSPMTVETDKNGTYILRFDFDHGAGLVYFGDLEVRSGSNFASAEFEVNTGEE